MSDLHQIEAYHNLGASYDIYAPKRNFTRILKAIDAWNDSLENYLETLTWNRETSSLESPYPNDTWHLVYVEGNAIKLKPYFYLWNKNTYNRELKNNYLEYGFKIDSSTLSSYYLEGYTKYDKGMKKSLLDLMKRIARNSPNDYIYLSDAITEGTAFQYMIDDAYEGVWDFDLAIIPKDEPQYTSPGHKKLSRSKHFYYISSNSNVVWEE